MLLFQEFLAVLTTVSIQQLLDFYLFHIGLVKKVIQYKFMISL